MPDVRMDIRSGTFSALIPRPPAFQIHYYAWSIISTSIRYTCIQTVLCLFYGVPLTGLVHIAAIAQPAQLAWQGWWLVSTLVVWSIWSSPGRSCTGSVLSVSPSSVVSVWLAPSSSGTVEPSTYREESLGILSKAFWTATVARDPSSRISPLRGSPKLGPVKSLDILRREEPGGVFHGLCVSNSHLLHPQDTVLIWPEL